MANVRNPYPYSVRRHRNDLSSPIRFSVVCNPGGHRVHTFPPSTESRAWVDCDRLNVMHLTESIHSDYPFWSWDECWQLARSRYSGDLPYRNRQRSERLGALSALTLADLPAGRCGQERAALVPETRNDPHLPTG